ncbi:MAG: chemotaxis protein CheD [Deltaproteobacteria bacterium]|nr:chemotaxis protein CheD [Deltaproteobacteria bacterium]
MSQLVVGISDMKVSRTPGDVLVTYALGSCIAVILWDPVLRAGGMIHYMLPLSKTSPEKAELTPAMFADTGVPMLFRMMYAMGCKKEDLVVKVAGGGQLYDDSGAFQIGHRNYVVLRKIFWKNDILITAEDVGGPVSRTVRLSVDTGEVVIRSKGEEVTL